MSSVYREGKGWTVSWFDSRHKRQFRRGLPTETMAKQIGERAEFQKLAAKHGLIETGAEQWAQQAARPVSEHLADFKKSLTAKKNTAHYVKETVDLVQRVFDAAGIDRIDQIDRHKIHTTIASLPAKRRVKDGRLSHRAMNKALTACKAFSGWLVDAERRPYNPLARLKGWDAKQDRRRVRLALTEEQLLRLIEVTPAQQRRGGMTGQERMMRYALGVGTGLRQGTLFSLAPESFHLDNDPPFIRIEAKNIKSRKQIDHPLSDELAAMLRPWLASLPKRKPIFPKLKWADPMTAYRQDLKAAGIEYHDPETVHYCDQHAQRNAFITAVIRIAGLKVAQDLAHHSTPMLTSEYGRMGMDDYAKALKSLPRLRRKDAGQEKKKIG